jgi:cytochrome c1
MTFAEVARAAEDLLAQGQAPSGTKVFTYPKAQGHRVSKRTVRRLMRDWSPPPTTPVPLTVADEDPVFHDAPVVPAAPAPPPDPVQQALARVTAAELDVDDARAQMRAAAVDLLLARGVVHDNLRFCVLDSADPAVQAAVDFAAEATMAYKQAWQALLAAKAALAQVERVHLRAAQEQWVAASMPTLVANLAFWAESLRTAQSDRMHSETKKNYKKVRFAYEREVANAPIVTNGVHAGEA